MPKRIDSVIRMFDKDFKIYQVVATLLECKLKELFPKAQSITARVKNRGSIAGKVLRKYQDISEPGEIYGKFTDFIGARVIFLRRDDVDAADETIRKNFTVDEPNSQNTAERLNVREFGYQSVHYIVCINKDWLAKNAKADTGKKSIVKPMIMKRICEKGEIHAELQIRTCLQHVWADLAHDSIYKGSRVIPRELLRSWNALAAILENVDEDIVRFLHQLEQYNRNQPFYIKKDLDQKIDTLEIIAETQLRRLPRNDPKGEAALMDCRDELVRLYRLSGRKKDGELLREIFSKVGEAEKEIDLTDPIKLKNELKNDLTNPKLLLYFLASPKGRKPGSDSDASTYILNHLLAEVIQRCEDMIKTSSELPWALAGKAFFLLRIMETDSDKRSDDKIFDEVLEAVLRLIDLCNERSVANLENARKVATPDTKSALKKLQSSINNHSFRNLNCSDGESAPKLRIIKLLLQLGVYAHTDDEMAARNELPPTVIIAGGCDSLKGAAPLDDFRKLFEAAQDGYNKIRFFTGAGDTGICTLPYGKNRVFRVGTWDSESADLRSHYRKNSLFEALTIWKKLQSQGYRFDDVALVGFGLGTISNWECRIALALGARVTVIGHKEFSRDYHRIFEGIPYWSDHPSLVRLPLIRGKKTANWSFQNQGAKVKFCKLLKKNGFPEPLMLRVFMLFRPCHKEMYSYVEKTKEGDEMTLLLHQIKQLRTVIDYQNLENLPSVKQYSSLHRKLSFLELFRDAHNGISPKLFDGKPSSPNDTELKDPDKLKHWLDLLHDKSASETGIDYDFGEREHARWYIERWLQGTRYGINKIDRGVPKEQIKNPCMVAWYDLDNDTIAKDTEFLSRYRVAKYILEELPKKYAAAIKKCFKSKKTYLTR